MINKTQRRARTILRTAALIAAAGALAATGATPADAATKSVHVSGRLYLQSDGSWKSTGDFLGTYELKSEQLVSEWKLGTNTVKLHFAVDQMTGCLDLNHNKKCDRHGPRGSITMTLRRLTTVDAQGTFVESYCTHPITAATGDFTGGLILMDDRARDGKGGNIKSTYRGDITLAR